MQNGNIEQVKILNKKKNSIITKNPPSTKFKLNDEILKSNNISFFRFLANIYASTPGIVYIFNKKTGKFQIDQKFEGLLNKNEYISELYLNDKSGNLWLSVTDASQRFKSSTRVISLIDNKYKSVDLELNRISGSTINSISQENDSTYWISTNTGLACYIKRTSDIFKDKNNTYIRKVLLKNDSFENYSNIFHALIEDLKTTDIQLKIEITKIRMEYREKYHLSEKECWQILQKTS